MVEAVLFDMGGVIVSGPWEGFAAYERASGLPEGLIRRINATDADTNAWAQMERGEIRLQEFAAAFEAEAAALGYRVDGMGWFDVVVESSVVGVRKPDPAFYTMACEALEVEPSGCVFLDDLGVNLKPARAMGMTTIKVVDADDALAELEAAVGFSLRG